MTKPETLWRCSTCKKLYGSESEALKCEEKHALVLMIQTVDDNPMFEHVPVYTDQQDSIISEDITEEVYNTNIENPSDFEKINTIGILTYSKIRRYDMYQRKGTTYSAKERLFKFKEE